MVRARRSESLSDDPVARIFGAGSPIKWYHYLIHLGYYIPYWIKFFFSEPFKEKKKDLDILNTVGSLLESETTDENLQKCKELVHLHRIIENTKARRRLEKWSLRVIALYLLIVFLVVLFCYVDVDFVKDRFRLVIPEPIMITILSNNYGEHHRPWIDCVAWSFPRKRQTWDQ